MSVKPDLYVCVRGAAEATCEELLWPGRGRLHRLEKYIYGLQERRRYHVEITKVDSGVKNFT